MTLQERINEDLKEALKAGEQIRRSTLSMVKSALHNQAIKDSKQDKGLTDEEVIKVLLSEAKKRKDAAEGFEKGNRKEQADKEREELKILEEYLPKQLSSEEVKVEIEKIITELGTNKKSDFGRLMGETMKRLGGQTNGTVVKEELEKLLE